MTADLLPDVPDAGEDAVPDPLLADLLRGGGLPAFYMPATMPRQLHGWQRLSAWLVIIMLISAAGAGICLTYGPEELWRLVGLGR